MGYQMATLSHWCAHSQFTAGRSGTKRLTKLKRDKHALVDTLKDTLVLVKLTAVRHATREKGIAASLIKTNNTQNTLRVPDFRSNDPIQLWLDSKFKATKPRGDLSQIAYGIKRPYPRANSTTSVLKVQDLGKIRYAWYHDPRIPISDPAKLFQLPEENGL